MQTKDPDTKRLLDGLNATMVPGDATAMTRYMDTLDAAKEDVRAALAATSVVTLHGASLRMPPDRVFQLAMVSATADFGFVTVAFDAAVQVFRSHTLASGVPLATANNSLTRIIPNADLMGLVEALEAKKARIKLAIEQSQGIFETHMDGASMLTSHSDMVKTRMPLEDMLNYLLDIAGDPDLLRLEIQPLTGPPS